MIKAIKPAVLTTGAILTLLLCLTGCGKQAELRDLTYLHFSYSTGNAVNAYVTYGLTEENGAFTATVKPEGVPDEEAAAFPVDAAFVQDAEALLRKYGVGGWDGYDKSNNRVLDGNSFSLSVKTADGRRVGAHGYMSWPRHYAEVRAGLDGLFSALLPAGTD